MSSWMLMDATAVEQPSEGESGQGLISMVCMMLMPICSVPNVVPSNHHRLFVVTVLLFYVAYRLFQWYRNIVLSPRRREARLLARQAMRQAANLDMMQQLQVHNGERILRYVLVLDQCRNALLQPEIAPVRINVSKRHRIEPDGENKNVHAEEQQMLECSQEQKLEKKVRQNSEETSRQELEEQQQIVEEAPQHKLREPQRQKLEESKRQDPEEPHQPQAEEIKKRKLKCQPEHQSGSACEKVDGSSVPSVRRRNRSLSPYTLTRTNIIPMPVRVPEYEIGIDSSVSRKSSIVSKSNRPQHCLGKKRRNEY
ncbi:uncharacterized protein LOC115629351 isoform X2 [Scaptodrosophila lebanonensis]|uniref:Uncharacterized protein LOC115629351 isoform X2 n=1 Tax=Drosophila lebanonensis TaxID=7225 RepID=A0A6J2TZY6_DROLE|nr:uncharacterized protein LOC115629351 isoform X2 [Scaptodrosophila lebanonensis]